MIPWSCFSLPLPTKIKENCLFLKGNTPVTVGLCQFNVPLWIYSAFYFTFVLESEVSGAFNNPSTHFFQILLLKGRYLFQPEDISYFQFRTKAYLGEWLMNQEWFTLRIDEIHGKKKLSLCRQKENASAISFGKSIKSISLQGT